MLSVLVIIIMKQCSEYCVIKHVQTIHDVDVMDIVINIHFKFSLPVLKYRPCGGKIICECKGECRVLETPTHHTPFRKDIWTQLWVDMYNSYHKINCEYIKTRNNTKSGMNLRRPATKTCRILHPCLAVETLPNANISLWTHIFLAFQPFFASVWTHTWKSLTGALVCTWIKETYRHTHSTTTRSYWRHCQLKIMQ